MPNTTHSTPPLTPGKIAPTPTMAPLIAFKRNCISFIPIPLSPDFSHSNWLVFELFYHYSRRCSSCQQTPSAFVEKLVAKRKIGQYIAVYRAVYTAQFKITNYELQMIVWAIAHEFNLFSEKTPQFVICNYEFIIRATARQTEIYTPPQTVQPPQAIARGGFPHHKPLLRPDRVHLMTRTLSTPSIFFSSSTAFAEGV